MGSKLRSAAKKRLLFAAWLLICCAHVASAVRSTRLYDALGVPPDADDRVIKKAYKRAALKWHPDRNPGDVKKAEKRFREVAEAYEVLSDADKRRAYDQFGEDALKAGGGGPGGGGPGGGGGFQFHGDPFEMFNSFFGGGGGMGGMGGGNVKFQFGGGGMGGGFGGGFPGGGMGGGFPGGGGGFRAGRGGGHGGHGGHGHGGGGGGSGSLYEDAAAVADLDADSFPEGASDWVWVVEFYAPWCGHCRQLAPAWRQVAEKLKGVVKVGAVNCDAHKALCSRHGVRGYPTIKALRPRAGADGWEDYGGGRSARELVDFAVGLIPSAVHHLRHRADANALLELCGGGSGSGGSKRGGNRAAAWGLCALLLTDKSDAPSLWKALSSAYRGKIAFGMLKVTGGSSGGDSGHADVREYFGAAATDAAPPAVVLVCNGDARTAERYAGQLKSEPLQRALNKFAAGRECAARVPLDASTDLNALTTAQLKAAVTARGVPCRGCAEKADFVAALRAALQAAGGGGGGDGESGDGKQQQQKEEL